MNRYPLRSGPAAIARLLPLLAVFALFLAGTTGPSQAKEPPSASAAKSAGDLKAALESLDPEHAAKMAAGLELFKKHVRPLLVNNCLGCHGGDSVEGEFDISTREKLLAGGGSGPAVVVHDSHASHLYKLISHADEPPMPYELSKLPEEAIARIGRWIDLGAPYDGSLLADDAAVNWTERKIEPEARDFWSFQPLHAVAVPAVADVAWCRTPVDRFVLTGLEKAGLAPNEPALRRQLIRRAYFDLIGLPPTPKEIEQFLADDSPDAYDRLIDRLLDSPHFGERWARHWLDVARFAESHGFEHDYDRPTAYHYRDFVIQAFNRDLPYDTFVRWQLAGDEYAPEDNLAMMATGFLAAGVHSTQITKNEVEKHRYNEMDDMLATTGTSMLGLTVGCARCHDHKYDPIPQGDYYRMLSAFTTTVRSEVDLDFDPDGYQKAKKEFDREHAPLADALHEYEAKKLPGRLRRWESRRKDDDPQADWVVLDVQRPKAKAGTEFEPTGDGSLRVTGDTEKPEKYTFVADTRLAGITMVRIEAMADSRLPSSGPGRGEGGGIALADVRVTAVPIEGSGKATNVSWQAAYATSSDKKSSAGAATDEDKKSVWSVTTRPGEGQAIELVADAPFGEADGTTLTLVLDFGTSGAQSFGRPRISVTTRTTADADADAPQEDPASASGNASAPVDLRGNAVPEAVLEALATVSDERTEAQQQRLLAWFRWLDPGWQRLNERVEEHLAAAPKPAIKKVLVATEGLEPVRLHSQGVDFFEETYYLARGDESQKQGTAALGFLQVLERDGKDDAAWYVDPPEGWRTSYRRRALADWMTDVDDGAGSLLARVIVNRLWQHHFGRGLVDTPSDFGTRGSPPSHPELLEWLAGELIRNDWRLKPIHKLIMASAAYRQSSRVDPTKSAMDPYNRLVWRRPMLRLEGEIIRDATLAVSGMLDERMFGPGTLDENMTRRSIYFTVKRSQLIPVMQVFDAPEGLSGIGQRSTTTIAPQALWLMNNANVRRAAEHFAERVAPTSEVTNEAAVRAAYEIAFARPPGNAELSDAAAFLEQQVATYGEQPPDVARRSALADFCQVLMCMNEFVYIE